MSKIFLKLDSEYTDSDLDNGKLIVPPIHNPFRWWRRDVLKKTLCIKLAIQKSVPSQNVKDFFMLVIAGVLVPDLINVTLGKLQLHFINRDKDILDVWKIFSNHAKMMIANLEQIPLINSGASHLYHVDSTSEKIAEPRHACKFSYYLSSIS